MKGKLEAEKERLAAQQSAEITGLEAQAAVKTLLPQMNTLAVDSLAAAPQLRKDVHLLQGLYREEAQLERSLQEKDHNLARRHFADPVHRLTMQADMIEADQKFQTAQQWLFFMARALEYKWNEPLDGLVGGWAMADLFKLRNADELRHMYDAMKSFDDEKVLSSRQDDRFDWFSVREDFLGYRRFGANGQPLFYVDPMTGETNVDAITMFRRDLTRRLTTNVIALAFSTVRRNHNTFFSADLYLDKIIWMKIRLPGQHSTTNHSNGERFSADLAYGGVSYIRNPEPGWIADPQQPDRLARQWTAYNTRQWYKDWMGTNRVWRFNEAIINTVTLLKTSSGAVPRDQYGFPNDIVESTLQMNTLKERSVAADQWRLDIKTWKEGVETLRIDDLEDIEIYFYHWAYERR